MTRSSVELEDRAAPMLPIVLRVRDNRRDTGDVFTLTVDASAAGFQFQPGQFNMLYVFGVGEAAASLAGDAADWSSIVHTIRAVGSVTNALARLRHGDAVGVRGPFGSAWPLEAARGNDVVIVAGGIGLPPLRPAIYHLSQHRQDYGRVFLLYGSRTPADVLFPAELEEWAKRDGIRIMVTVDRGEPSWRGSIGLVTRLFCELDLVPERTIGLVCGPEVMMRFAIQEFNKRGVSDDCLYVSMERNMQCAVGFCGHCQFGPEFVCVDGPVFRYDRIKRFFEVREA